MIKRIFNKKQASNTTTAAPSSTTCTITTTSSTVNSPVVLLEQSIQPHQTTSILNRLKLQLENVVSLKQLPTHNEQPTNRTNSSSASSASSSETTIELAKYTPDDHQQPFSKLNKKQHKKSAKTPSPTSSTSTLKKCTSTVAAQQSAPPLSANTKIDYPLRTRLYRHLSSGNAALSPTQTKNSASKTPSVTSITPNGDDLFFNQYLSSLNSCHFDDALRRQSWGSYSYLAQQQSGNGARSPYHYNHHNRLFSTTHRSTATSHHKTLIPNSQNNNSSSNSSIFESWFNLSGHQLLNDHLHPAFFQRLFNADSVWQQFDKTESKQTRLFST
jgi:hypothetical protein